MHAERWDRLKALFLNLIELDPPDRPAVMRRCEQSDPDLVGHLRRMLKAHETGPCVLDRPAGRLGEAALARLRWAGPQAN